MDLLIDRIEEPREVAALREVVADLIHPPWDFNLDWVRQRRWAVVPVSEGFLVGREDSLLAVAVLELGCRQCIGVAIAPEITEHVCPAYRLWATETCFLQLNKEYVGVEHVVLDTERSFAVLFADEYKLYAGSRRFVERATGRPVSVARRQFLETSALTQVAERYEVFNGDV